MYIDPALIANQQLYGLISSVTKCIICEGILYNPLKCTICDNSFCKQCITKWKTQSNNCPFQCVNQDYTPSRYLEKILSKLTFFCEKGCLDIITYNDLQKHCSFTCVNLNLRESLQKASVELKQLQIENDVLNKLNRTLLDKIERLKLNNFSKKKENVFISKHHPHQMIFAERKVEWICNVCKEVYNSKIKSALCSKCDFDLCAICYFNEFMNLN